MTPPAPPPASEPSGPRHRVPRRLPEPSRALLPALLLVAIGLLVSGPGGGVPAPTQDGDVPVHPRQGAVPPVPFGPRAAVPGVPDVPDVVEVPRGTRLRSVSTAASRPRVPEASDGPLAQPAAAEAAPLPARLLRPSLRLYDVDAEALGLVMADPEVAFATALHVGQLDLSGGETLSVGVVEPRGFRVMAPAVTAEAQPVWDALARGEVLLSHDRAGQLGLRAGSTLALAEGGTASVGGAASNGAPPLVDAIVARSAGLDVGETRRTLLVAAHRGVDIPVLAARLEAATGRTPHPIPAAWPATASLVGDHTETVAAFAPFAFSPGDGGRIRIDAAWEEAHITTEAVPILGDVRCHRLILPQLRAALEQIIERGLADALDPDDYGGCYLPRHIDWNPAASLSMHAWGVAFDVNVATNWLGDEPQLDRRVVEVFADHGFGWGGDWRRPDGMHFELERLLDAEELEALEALAD